MVKPEEQLLKSFIADPKKHAEKCIVIRDHNTAEIVPLIYNDPQDIVHKIVEKQKQEYGIVRVLLLKTRRFGGSTQIQGRYYSKTSLNFNRNAFIVGHEKESTNTLFEMAKLMQERNPIAPSIRANNEKALKFDNAAGTGLKSEYRLASAENLDAGRSQGIHYLHASEEAFWRDGRTLLTGLLQCVPDPPAESEIFRESTANGYGNSFQEDVFRAYGEGQHVYYESELCEVAKHMPDSKHVYPFAWRSEGQDWILIFIPWFVYARYSKEFESQDKRDEFKKEISKKVFDSIEMQWVELEASKLRRKYGLTLEQLYWREWAIENKCNGSVDKFHQEYPATVEEAFLSTGTNVYPKELCDQIELECTKPLVIGDLVERAGQIRIRRNKYGKFSLWERPKKEEQYFMCIDSGGGENARQKKEKTDPDPTCIDIWNHRTGNQVAQWHGHIEYDLIGDVAEMAGKLYEMAPACVELQNHGYTVVADLKRKKYPMYESKPDEPGWSTNRKTKPLMVDDLYRMSRDGLIHIRSKPTVSEMRTFIEENGKYGAASGCHDERVDTAGMASQMFQLMPSRIAKSEKVGSYGFTNISDRHQPEKDGYREFYARV
jgi:hypothetical protein